MLRQDRRGPLVVRGAWSGACWANVPVGPAASVATRAGDGPRALLASTTSLRGLKSENRRPKSEGIPKPEIRNNASPDRSLTCQPGGRFGLRDSDFFRGSGFGLRVWPARDGWQCSDALMAATRTSVFCMEMCSQAPEPLVLSCCFGAVDMLAMDLQAVYRRITGGLQAD